MPDFAEEISKLLPVKDIYEDAAQPATRQVGAIGGDLMKTLHLVLAPIQYVAALQDRYRAFIERSVRKVPEERRVQPAPQIVGPVLEGIRYEPEGTEIEEMFANLLANGMDKDNVGLAHPAYPSIISQLSRDEALCYPH
jgi:Abortive infection alpha